MKHEKLIKHFSAAGDLETSDMILIKAHLAQPGPIQTNFKSLAAALKAEIAGKDPIARFTSENALRGLVDALRNEMQRAIRKGEMAVVRGGPESVDQLCIQQGQFAARHLLVHAARGHDLEQ